MGRAYLSAGTLTAPLPAVMVTVGDMERANIITVAWTGILSTHPARAYISVRPTRHSHKMLTESGEFVINLTTEKLAYATDFSGIYTGSKLDKFEKLGLTKIKSKNVAPPTVAEAPLSLECRVCEVLAMGTHDVFIADILGVSVDDALLDEKGKIHLERAGLMAYAHGEYYALGKVIGKFGMSAVKKKNPKPKERSVNTDLKTANVKKENGTSEKKNIASKPAVEKTDEPFYIGALKYKRRKGRK